jgi:hypothetical protein
VQSAEVGDKMWDNAFWAGVLGSSMDGDRGCGKSTPVGEIPKVDWLLPWGTRLMVGK